MNFRDASNVEDMAYMFYNSWIKKVEIRNTSSVTSMLNMFAAATELKEGNFSDWDTSKVKTMRNMFH